MDTTSIQTGGKMLGEGAYGCVFAGPVLKCKGDSVAKLPKNTQVKDGMPLTKITIKSEADDEFSIAKQIQKIPLWKNYFLVAESICEPAPKQEQIQECDIIKGKELNKYRVLTSSYGGVPIVSYKLNFYKNSFEDIFKHLLEAGALLALFGVVHWDLHLGNILVDSAAVPRIIDFNLAKNMREKAIPNELSIKFRFDLFQLPPDSSLVVGVYKGVDPYVAIEQIIKGKDIKPTASSLTKTRNGLI
jgi:serine/threonine protein kinase